MKILLNYKYNHKNKNFIGGIETLNINLFNRLKNEKNFNIYQKPNLKFYDVIISSNDAKIFDKIKAYKKVLWLHNQLQIEKAFRKKQFFSIIKNNIIAVFVSSFLENITSKIYRFNKRIIIPNFLDKQFENLNIPLNRKPIIMWCVTRDRGLNSVINLWKNNIIVNNPDAEFHIFGINNIKSKKKLLKSNIYVHGQVSKKTLIKFYKKSIGSICLGYDETFCLNAIESMSCGVPVLSFNKTSLKNLIKNNVNGYKVDNFYELTIILNRLLNKNSQQRLKLIKNTYKFSKNFYFKKIKKKWINIINK